MIDWLTAMHLLAFAGNLLQFGWCGFTLLERLSDRSTNRFLGWSQQQNSLFWAALTTPTAVTVQPLKINLLVCCCDCCCRRHWSSFLIFLPIKQPTKQCTTVFSPSFLYYSLIRLTPSLLPHFSLQFLSVKLTPHHLHYSAHFFLFLLLLFTFTFC